MSQEHNVPARRSGPALLVILLSHFLPCLLCHLGEEKCFTKNDSDLFSLLTGREVMEHAATVRLHPRYLDLNTKSLNLPKGINEAFPSHFETVSQTCDVTTGL